MLDQLWYTASDHGLGLVRGFRVRAASAGLKEVTHNRVRALEPFFRYKLPPGSNTYSVRPEDSPICLAYVALPTERILLRKQYASNYTGRPGNFFAHIIAGFDTPFDARDAIQRWHSPFWHSIDETLLPATTELPPISDPGQITSGALDPDVLHAAAIRAYLPPLIRAYVLAPTTEHFFIAAPPPVVATLLWGLAVTLPRTFLRDLTFSTFETDLLSSPARVVGTCWSEAILERDETAVGVRTLLPEACYAGVNWAVNCYTGRISAVPTHAEVEQYAANATEAFISGGAAGIVPFQLRELLTSAESLTPDGVDVPTLMLLAKVNQGLTSGTLTQADVMTVLSNPRLAAEMLNKPAISDHIISYAANPASPTFTAKLKDLVVAALGAPSLKKALDSFGLKVMAAMVRALETGQDWTHFFNLMQFLTEAAPPKGNKTLWQSLYTQVQPHYADFVTHSGTRAHLLLHWQSAGVQVAPQWLHGDWAFVSEVLRTNLPHDQKKTAVTHIVADSGTGQQSLNTQLVEQNATLFEEVMRESIRQPQTQTDVTALFAALARSSYNRIIPLLNTLVVAVVDRDPDLADTLFEHARWAGLDTWLRDYSATMPLSIAKTRFYQKQATDFLAALPVDAVFDPATDRVLQAMKQDYLKPAQDWRNYSVHLAESNQDPLRDPSGLISAIKRLPSDGGKRQAAADYCVRLLGCGATDIQMFRYITDELYKLVNPRTYANIGLLCLALFRSAAARYRQTQDIAPLLPYFFLVAYVPGKMQGYDDYLSQKLIDEVATLARDRLKGKEQDWVYDNAAGQKPNWAGAWEGFVDKRQQPKMPVVAPPTPPRTSNGAHTPDNRGLVVADNHRRRQPHTTEVQADDGEGAPSLSIPQIVAIIGLVAVLVVAIALLIFLAIGGKQAGTTSTPTVIRLSATATSNPNSDGTLPPLDVTTAPPEPAATRLPTTKPKPTPKTAVNPTAPKTADPTATPVAPSVASGGGTPGDSASPPATTAPPLKKYTVKEGDNLSSISRNNCNGNPNRFADFKFEKRPNEVINKDTLIVAGDVLILPPDCTGSSKPIQQ